MSVAVIPDFDTQLLRGIQTALRQARGLGDHVETMDITASVSDGVCHVHFSPIPAPGTIQTGGDLTVSVNSDTDEIIGYERGQ
jgi:hypothetical protein